MISREELVCAARLAAVSVDDAELDRMVTESAKILALIDEMSVGNAADTTCDYAEGTLRDDAVCPSCSADALLSNAACHTAEYFVHTDRKARGI